MSKVITVEYQGKMVTLTQLGKLTGLGYSCLAARYRQGQRGERLWRSLDAHDQARIANRKHANGYDNHHMRKEVDTKRAKQAAEHERRLSQQQRRRAAIAAARAEHAAAFSAPLIDSKLLTPSERKKIRESVVSVQRWHGGQSSYL